MPDEMCGRDRGNILYEGLHPHLHVNLDDTWTATLTIGDRLFHTVASTATGAMSKLVTQLAAALAGRQLPPCRSHDCDRPGIYQPPDGGPGALCTRCLWAEMAEVGL